MAKINNQIKVYRARYNLTQEDLAGKCGVTRQTIIAVEKNKYVPSLELAFKIAKVFNTSVVDIFSYK